MTQPQHGQPPKYRRSWLGGVIVLALVVQWAGLWVRTTSHWDALLVHFGAHVLWIGSKNCAIVMEVYYRPEFSVEWPSFDYNATVKLPGFTPKHHHSDTLPAAMYETHRSESHLWLNVPYWSLIAFTLLAYFAVGRFRRWRFERQWAHENSRPKAGPMDDRFGKWILYAVLLFTLLAVLGTFVALLFPVTSITVAG